MCPSGTTTTVTTTHRPTSELREAFNVLDADRDGKISKDDLLRTFYAASDIIEEDDLVGTMITVADSNMDGFVQFDEFVRVLDSAQNNNNHVSALGRRHGGGGVGGGSVRRRIMDEAFRVMDRDGDGRLGYDDLKKFMEMGGMPAEEEDIKAMVRLGGDGAESDGVSFDMLLRILDV